MAALVRTVETLVTASLAESTRRVYHRCMSQFIDFVHTQCPGANHLPADSGTMALFIAHMYVMGKSASTIVSMLAALSYYHKVRGYKDPISHFIVKKMLVGVSKLRPSVDMRYPVTLPMLNTLVTSCQQVSISHYYNKLYSSMYSLAFNAFLRPGEITQSCNNIQFYQVTISNQTVSIQLSKFKHYHGKPVTIVVHSNGHLSCPVKTLCTFITLRGKSPGPLFCHPTMSPISPEQFSQSVSMSCKWAGFQQLGVKPHSFRIGAATHAATLGYTEETISRMGRWHSNSFKRYIRIPTFTSRL